MTDFSGSTIGERIEQYRRANRLTRDELSEATRGEVGRDVIANIENGRRKDVTVSQLLALSAALQVPPTALIYDLAQPGALAGGPRILQSMSASEGQLEAKTRSMVVADALAWCGFNAAPPFENETRSSRYVFEQVFAWQGYRQAVYLLEKNYEKYSSAEDPDEVPRAQKFELGVLIGQAWKAYEDAVALGIKGLVAPAIPEELSAQLTEGGVIEINSMDDIQIYPVWETDGDSKGV